MTGETFWAITGPIIAGFGVALVIVGRAAQHSTGRPVTRCDGRRRLGRRYWIDRARSPPVPH